MKIITEDAVYIERKDFVFLLSLDIPLSTSVFFKSFDKKLTTLTEKNQHELIKMNGKYEKKFFSNLDWILDYEELKNINDVEITNQIKELDNKRHELLKEYISFNEIQKINNKNVLTKIRILEYKIDALKEYLLSKRNIETIENIETNEIEKVLKIPTSNTTFI